MAPLNFRVLFARAHPRCRPQAAHILIVNPNAMNGGDAVNGGYAVNGVIHDAVNQVAPDAMNVVAPAAGTVVTVIVATSNDNYITTIVGAAPVPPNPHALTCGMGCLTCSFHFAGWERGVVLMCAVVIFLLVVVVSVVKLMFLILGYG
jgi:hypothetical protein